MSQCLKDWIDAIAKIAGVLGLIFIARTYVAQQRLRRAEWVKSLYEKFFENTIYKEVRVWLDYGALGEELNAIDAKIKVENEEKFTDFLNFFEFIGVLYTRKQLSFNQIYDLFDYYLKKIKSDPDCQFWIKEYSFEKLKLLLSKIN